MSAPDPSEAAASRALTVRALGAFFALLAGTALAVASTASASIADETALAEKYAPVARLVEHPSSAAPASRTSRWT